MNLPFKRIISLLAAPALAGFISLSAQAEELK